MVGLVALVLITACGGGGPDAGGRTAEYGRPQLPTAVGGGVHETTFWNIVQDARRNADGDPEIMAEALASRFRDADDETLRDFQTRLVEAHSRLYTWRDRAAAEMICGFLSDDVFTDWRVTTLGRDTYEQVVREPDNLAEIDDLSGGCERLGEFFGAAVAGIWFNRHGYETDLPILEPIDPPTGDAVINHTAIRASMPRLSARIPQDGLGQEPRSFDEAD